MLRSSIKNIVLRTFPELKAASLPVSLGIEKDIGAKKNEDEIIKLKNEIERLQEHVKFSTALYNKIEREQESSEEQILLLSQALKDANERVMAVSSVVEAKKEIKDGESNVEKKEINFDCRFGQLVLDLGYKRIFLCSTNDLINIPVWKQQRSYNHERAKLICLDKIKEMNDEASLMKGFPGLITLFENESNDTIGIIDGQHRVGSLKMLQDMGVPVNEKGNLIEVYKVKDDKGTSNLFTQINKAEPVRLMDLPETAVPMEEKLILNQVVDELEEQFPAMFSSSQKCRPPHVNKELLKEELYLSGLVRRLEVKDTKELLEWILNKNVALNDRNEQDWMEGNRGGKQQTAAVEKAKKNLFFLGMDKSWLLAA